MLMKDRIETVSSYFEALYPNAECELIHQDPFQLLIAVMLSAQTTDKAVNKVTEVLFAKYPDVFKMNQADITDIEAIIRKIGLYKNKAKNIKGITELLIEKYQGHVLPERQMLESLPGVGRKTANVVLSVAFDVPAFAVDTHVERVSKRLKLAYEKDNVKVVEQKLMKKFDISKWNKLHHQFIFFGRYFCTARNPNCKSCQLISICKNGRKYIENK